MRHHPLLLLILVVAACSSGQEKEPELPPELQSLIESLRQAHAPDSRVALLDLEAEKRDGEWAVVGSTNLPAAQRELGDALEELGMANEVDLLPEASLEGKNYGIVRLSACNIRAEPQHAAELSTQATLGTPLKVYKAEQDWYLVQTPDGYLGWLDADGFTLMDEAGYRAWQDAKKVVYLPDFGFSYASAKRDARPVSDLLSGNILLHIADAGTFTEVEYPDGRRAFLPAGQWMPYGKWLERPAPEAAQVIATARRFLGRPYLWGGTSGKAVDCSGFTKTVFYLHGLLLPRDASQQVRVGAEVPTDTTLANVEPGDLLFFGRAATEEQPEKITHVALYLGNGEMIHAAGTVKVESLRRGDPHFAEERLETFVRARRFIGEDQAGIVPLREAEGYN